MPRAVLRTLLTGLTVVGSLALATGVASAHVTVTPTSVPAGTDATLTFRVPDEKDDASTVGLRLVLADGAALHEVSVLAKPGWDFSTAAPSGTATNSPQPTVPQATATAVPPATPMPNMPGMSGMSGMGGMSMPGVLPADTSTPAPSASSSASADSNTDEGGPAVGSINWTARDSSTAIRPGTFGEFEISAAMPAGRSSLIFAAIQTYSDGTVVRWIDRAAPGSAEPAHPAPTVTLGSGGSMPGMSMPGMSGSDTPAPRSDSSTNMGMAGMDMSGSRSDSVNVALVVAIAALIAAMTAAVLAMNALNRARRAGPDGH